MRNLIQSTTEFAMHIVRAYVHPGDTVIDATCGNGHDTLKLAGMGPARIFAFDLQADAIESTRSLLISKGWRPSSEDPEIILTRLGHERMPDFFRDQGLLAEDGDSSEDAVPSGKGFASAVVFNLGYLPGGDKGLTTRTGTTLTAVRGALQLLKPGGLICITMYSGHPEGANEKRALLAWAEELDSRQWHVSYISMPNQKHDPPEILLITRK